jgi:transcriptional regulator GlxA family with amidase domain
MRNKRATRLIGFVGFDGLTALDLIGPLEAFAVASTTAAPRYECQIFGVTSRPFRAESGVVMQPHASLAEAPRLDTLIVPGGSGLREPVTNARIVDWIRTRAASTRRIASVCTGIYGLAPTGLLDGRRVTTHWNFARDVAERFPALRVQAERLFIKDGKYFTAAGVTSGIDLALALIEADHGTRLAVAAARELIVYLKRNGGQAQYSGPLQLQASSRDSLGALTSWIAAHLDAPLTTETLAQRAHLSARQLHRRFRAELGRTPAQVVERLRMDAARDRLDEPRHSIEGVARATGYRSADVFRRVFMRHFGVSPSDYRRRFASTRDSAA